MLSNDARCALTLTLILLGLAALACDNLLAPQTLPTPDVLPTLQTLSTETPAPSALPTVEVALAAYADPWYEVGYPAAWRATGGYLPNEQEFAPADRPLYGIRVRFEGTGYTFSVLDALINSELEAMRREGWAPQEVAIRYPQEIAAGQAAGLSADFLATIDAAPVRVQVAAVVANFTGAYVLRLWSPLIDDDRERFGAAYARIVREFAPLYGLAPTETPTPGETTGPRLTLTPAPDETTAAPELLLTSTPEAAPTESLPTLVEEPYRSAAFEMPYPAGWSPTTNIDGSITFLTADPELLVGISVTALEGQYDPYGDPVALLEAYLDDVTQTVPGAVIGEQRVEENAEESARGISATYVVPYSGDERLVYRVTILVSLAAEGSAYRLVQWSPESLYETGYRDLYRAVAAGFRPVASP